MKNRVYLCVLSLAVLPLLNCAPKDKLLRQPFKKDGDVVEMEAPRISGFEYSYYLTSRAAEVKQIVELAIDKEKIEALDLATQSAQPRKSTCQQVRVLQESATEVKFEIRSRDCSYQGVDTKTVFSGADDVIVRKRSGKVVSVQLYTTANADWSLSSINKENKQNPEAILTRGMRELWIDSLDSETKGELSFRVKYSGSLKSFQKFRNGKLTAEEDGIDEFSFDADFHRSAEGEWTVTEPYFVLKMSGTRILKNAKKKTEVVTPKRYNTELYLSPATVKSQIAKTLRFVGDCDRLAGVLDVASYEHTSSEKGFSGAVELSDSRIAVVKSGNGFNLPSCEKKVAGGYTFEPPFSAVYLK